MLAGNAEISDLKRVDLRDLYGSQFRGRWVL